MQIIFAPDSFKGSLTALQITALLKRAAQKHFPEAVTHAVPIADGGEGTVDALVAATGGEYRQATVTGPLGERVTARYGLLDGGAAAVIETAQAGGLPLVPQDKRDPRNTTSFGTGELLRIALHCGTKRLLVGIGGSATNDGGMGMLAALGASFTDASDRECRPVGGALGNVRRADFSALDPLLADAEITVICDVTNPLLGPGGATYIYGPQKGASPAVCDELENGMKNYAAVVARAVGRDVAGFAGAGAAGGLGAALGGVLGAQMRSGVDAVLDAAGFDKLLPHADLVITGEGRMDGQTVRFGKVPAGVAARCAAHGVPVIAVTGGMGEGAEGFFDIAQSSIQTTVNAVMTLEEAMQNAEALYLSAADRAFRLLKIGRGLRETRG